MQKNIPFHKLIFFFLISTLCEIMSPSILSSQSVWYGREKKNSVTLEINKPVEPSDSVLRYVIPEMDALSGSVFLSGRYTLKKNKNITFVADFPIAHGYINDTVILNDAETIIGNPYVGAEFDIPNSPLFFELGFRIPLVPHDKALARIAGIISDFDRSEAFLKDVFPVYGAVNFNSVSSNNILFAAKGGINLWFNSDSLNYENSPSVIVDYNVQTGYIDKRIEVMLSAVGRYDVSSGARFPEKRTLLQYGLSVVVPLKSFRPGISFRVPGNDRAGDIVNYVIGLDFKYLFL